ncbi:DEAD/DEAH box helicase family protein [Corynebacterium striatum]|uniref:type I restriction endonuclease subunit R n=1 Tax=Corynebacterium striatum TaxID=43770 RepID=UPI003B59CAB6
MSLENSMVTSTPPTPPTAGRNGVPGGPARSNFSFVRYVWPTAYEECLKVERFVDADPVISCFYARKVLERVVNHIWAFRGLGDTGYLSLADMTRDREFVKCVGNDTMLRKMTILRKSGNDAAHADDMEGKQAPATPQKARAVVAHLYDLMAWAVRYHSANQQAAPGPQAAFDTSLLGQSAADASGIHVAGRSQAQTAAYLKKLAQQDEELKKNRLLLDEAKEAAREAEEKRLREAAQFELKRRSAEVRAKADLADAKEHAEAERAAAQQVEEKLAAKIEALEAKLAEQEAAAAERAGAGAQPDAPLAIGEAETRRQLIDPMLEAAGFSDDSITRELELHGMPNPSGVGYADYVLRDDDRTPLAVIEAKKSMESMSVGSQQVKLYADCIEREYGTRPVMLCTNGYHIDLIDDAANLPGSGVGYPAREVEGFPTAQQLRRMIGRRTMRALLSETPVDTEIAGGGARTYQLEAIRAVTETLEARRRRQALLVMATGTGKTRVAVATAKLLRQAGWVGKVLFLADRTALVNQAHKAFVSMYAESTPVNLIKNPEQVGDVYVTTYNTMMNLIGDDGDTPAKFGPFDFDLIVVDEAHRSVYNRFKRILEYFDAYVVGLTATPKSEIDHDTYALFEMEDKTPSFEYSLDEAVADGNLVPFKTARQDSLFLRRGMSYDELSPEEQLAWDTSDWGTDEDGGRLDPPGQVSSAEINRYLFNKDTIRKVLKTVVENGIRVGGDQLGKTIIFARTQRHAELIKQVFDATFPEYSRTGASVITTHTKYAQSALDEFADPDGDVNIAISVDMLDTGVDVPEVVNLVFFKPVYSPTKFWQMVGRGTRLRPDLFGPGTDKTHFLIFDFCGNVDEFYRGEARDSATGRPRSLSEKLFDARVGLLAQLDKHAKAPEMRAGLADSLHASAASVPLGHIMVRPGDKEILVRYRERSAWNDVDEEKAEQLSRHLGHLPLNTMKEPETAKRFDLVILKLQVGLLDHSPEFAALRQRVERMANDLMAVSSTIPMVAERRSFLERALDPEWWNNVTVEDLETIRIGMRSLIQFVPKGKRNAVTLDIQDEMGELTIDDEMPSQLPGTGSYPSQLEQQLREVLQEHANDLAMIKLRSARTLNAEDVAALEAVVAQAGRGSAGSTESIDKLRERMGGDSIPAFIRRLVGLDEAAVREQFADLLSNTSFNAAQIRFIKMLVDVLVHNGGVAYEEIFQPPFDEEGSVVDIFHNKTDFIVDLRKRLERIEATAQAT